MSSSANIKKIYLTDLYVLVLRTSANLMYIHLMNMYRLENLRCKKNLKKLKDTKFVISDN